MVSHNHCADGAQIDADIEQIEQAMFEYLRRSFMTRVRDSLRAEIGLLAEKIEAGEIGEPAGDFWLVHRAALLDVLKPGGEVARFFCLAERTTHELAEIDML